MGGLIENVSTFGPAIDSLFLLVLALTSVAFVLVEGLLIYFLIRYRGRPGQRATYIHGNRPIELFWTVGTGLALLSLALYQRNTWAMIKQDLPDESTALVIGLSADQFDWNATYTGDDGRLHPEWGVEDSAQGDDLLAPPNTLHVPVGRPVIVWLKSKDVIHSFFIPQFRLKQDTVPGMTIQSWFQATQTGEFEIACAELCGLGHYRMRGRVTVESPEDFEAWLADLKARRGGG